MSDVDRQKWDAKYREASDSLPQSSRVLEQLDHMLPRVGRALDLAGGDGRNSIWLAQRGLDLTLSDISEVGLARAQRYARQLGISLDIRLIDFDDEPLPPGPWDLILSMLYLNRDHFRQFADVLAHGGYLVYIQPTRRNLERHDRPPERFLLADGELPSLVSGLDIVHYEEGWLADGRHDALLIARRP